MKRVLAHVTAAFALTSAAVLFVTATTALAKEVPSGLPGNPGHHYGEIANPGHHYGQLRHQPPPAPTPQPDPQPTPAALTPPGATGTATVYVTRTGATPAPASGVTAPQVPAAVEAQAGSAVQGGAARPDDVSWLVLLILPALLAVWLIALSRLVRRAAGGRRAKAAAALAGAPAA